MKESKPFFGSHESFDRDDHTTPSSDRSFGLVMATFLAVVAGGGWFRDSHHWAWWLLASASLAAVALVQPRWLSPLNYLWLRFGLLLHAVISPVVLFVLYYICISPIGAMMRLTGKDPLRLRLDPAAETYWIRRTPPGPASGSMKNQY